MTIPPPTPSSPARMPPIMPVSAMPAIRRAMVELSNASSKANLFLPSLTQTMGAGGDLHKAATI